MTNNPLERDNCWLCVAPKTESSESSSGNTRSNRLSAPWLSDSFTRHGDRIKPLVPTVLSKQDWRASFFRLTSRRQVTIIQSNDCQCLPPGVAARCDGHSLHVGPRKSHTTICTAHEEAHVPISPSQKVLQGPPGDGRTEGISAASSSISSPALLLALASHSPAPSAKGHRRPSFGLTGLDPAG